MHAKQLTCRKAIRTRINHSRKHQDRFETKKRHFFWFPFFSTLSVFLLAGISSPPSAESRKKVTTRKTTPRTKRRAVFSMQISLLSAVIDGQGKKKLKKKTDQLGLGFISQFHSRFHFTRFIFSIIFFKLKK